MKLFFLSLLILTISFANSEPCDDLLDQKDITVLSSDGPNMAIVMKINTPIPESEIAATKKFLEKLKRKQISMMFYNKQWSVDDFRSEKIDLDVLASPTLIKATTEAMESAANSFLLIKNEKYEVRLINFVMRLSSNTVGASVRPNKNGADSEGFHDHGYLGERTVSLVWTIDGEGPILKVNNKIYKTKERELAMFGGFVPHGSPDSPQIRLVVVGVINLQKIDDPQ